MIIKEEDKVPAVMWGPAFHDDTPTFVPHSVERIVPYDDIRAFEAAGYVKGSLPEHLKPKAKPEPAKPEPEAPKKGK